MQSVARVETTSDSKATPGESIHINTLHRQTEAVVESYSVVCCRLAELIIELTNKAQVAGSNPIQVVSLFYNENGTMWYFDKWNAKSQCNNVALL